jgi:hypothetical protein
MIRNLARGIGFAALLLPFIASAAVAQSRTGETPERPAAAPSGRSTSGRTAAPAGEARRTGAEEPGSRARGEPSAGGARANRPGGARAALLDTFDDWTAYATPPGRGRICYALSQPTGRTPKTLSREDAFLFVSIRPAENVRGEVAVMMGFPVKEPEPPAEAASADAAGRAPAEAPKPAPEQQLVVGNARFAIAGKEENAWLADPAQEGSLVAAMARNQKLLVRAVSKRGSATSDEYSLKGFNDALKKAREECR